METFSALKHARLQTMERAQVLCVNICVLDEQSYGETT